MTICALLLARQFYDLQPRRTLKYATLGLLFVNVSIGGTLTHFAAPPVLMVARPWEWDTAFMLAHFGWRAALAIVDLHAVYYLVFRRELRGLAARPAVPESCAPTPEAAAVWRRHCCRFPGGSPRVYVLFIVWTVVNAHYPGAVPGWLPVLPRLRPRDRRLLDALRLQDAAAGRILSRPVSSSTADCRDGGSHRCSRA